MISLRPDASARPSERISSTSSMARPAMVLPTSIWEGRLSISDHRPTPPKVVDDRLGQRTHHPHPEAVTKSHNAYPELDNILHSAYVSANRIGNP